VNLRLDRPLICKETGAARARRVGGIGLATGSLLGRMSYNSEEGTMFGRKRSAADVTADARDKVSAYGRLAHDEKLRRQLAAAVASGRAAQQRAKTQFGPLGIATRLGSDPVFRAQVAEAIVQIQNAKGRIERNQSHKARNAVLFLGGVGMVIAAVPGLRHALLGKVRGGSDDWSPEGPMGGSATIEEEIEVEVPVTTAYNQWTQFEEFPRFMEGVDEVRQLDDTLLHWAATVAGTHAEWDAKILEQEPDRRIAWESVDGKQTRGVVTFEPAGSGSRTRIRLRMSYMPERATEKVGSAVGLDDRRVRGDLQRFRELIEGRQSASGAWRGEIADGRTRGEGVSS
jgi:uncharacterized membrane protein